MFKNLSTEKIGISVTQNELIELSLSYGFKSVDLDLEEFSSRVAARGLDHARRLYDSARLKFASFRLPLDLGADEEAYREQLKQAPAALELADAMDCRLARVTVGAANDIRPFQENFELHRRRLAEVSAILQSSNIRLGLELNPLASAREGWAFEFLHTLSALAQLLGMVDDENVGVVVDLWGLYATGEPDAWKNLKPEQIASVELADAPQDVAPQELTAEQRLLPGQTGVIDAAAALRQLAEMGFAGPVTPVPSRESFGDAVRDEIIRQTSEALGEVWKAAEPPPAAAKQPATASSAADV